MAHVAELGAQSLQEPRRRGAQLQEWPLPVALLVALSFLAMTPSKCHLAVNSQTNATLNFHFTAIRFVSICQRMAKGCTPQTHESFPFLRAPMTLYFSSSKLGYLTLASKMRLINNGNTFSDWTKDERGSFPESAPPVVLSRWKIRVDKCLDSFSGYRWPVLQAHSQWTQRKPNEGKNGNYDI